MIKAVIFDMDGVLINSEPMWKTAEKAVFKTIGIKLNNAMCEKTMGLRVDEVIDFWYQQHKWKTKTPKQVEQEILETLVIIIKQKGQILPGVEKTIQFFQRLGLPLAIATSSPTIVIDAVLSALKIKQYFSVIHSAENEPYGKPHPAVYLTAAKKLKINPTNCLVFEDSLNGLIAAKAAKMKTIVIPEKKHFNAPQFSIANVQLKYMKDFTAKHFKKINGI